jgi:hypothetical protein
LEDQFVLSVGYGAFVKSQVVFGIVFGGLTRENASSSVSIRCLLDDFAPWNAFCEFFHDFGRELRHDI